MESSELWNAPGLVPSLAYKDVTRAAQWLARVFGFRERKDARLSWPGGCLTWMELDDVLISLTTAGGHDLQSPQDTGGVCVGLKVCVNDVDQHFAHAKAQGAIIMTEPEDGFWGGRIYRARDLEGHQWEFSQRGRDRVATGGNCPRSEEGRG